MAALAAPRLTATFPQKASYPASKHLHSWLINYAKFDTAQLNTYVRLLIMTNYVVFS